MKKKVFLTVTIVFLLTSCQLMDQLFFSTDAVTVNELKDFEGETVSTDKEALKALAGSAIASVFQVAEEYEEKLSEELGELQPNANTRSMSSFNPLQAYVELMMSDLLTPYSRNSTSSSFSHSFTKQTLGPFVLTGSYAVFSTVEDPTQTMKGNGEGKLRAKLEESLNVLNSFVLNVDAKGNISVQKGTNSTSIDAKVAFASSLGASINANDEHKGGKFILDFKYVSRIKGTFSESDMENSDSLFDKMDISLEVLLRVYDNSNKEVASYKFTEKDLFAFVDDLEIE